MVASLDGLCPSGVPAVWLINGVVVVLLMKVFITSVRLI